MSDNREPRKEKQPPQGQKPYQPNDRQGSYQKDPTKNPNMDKDKSSDKNR